MPPGWPSLRSARRAAISATIWRRACSVSGYSTITAVAARMTTAGIDAGATLIEVTAASLWLAAPET